MSNTTDATSVDTLPARYQLAISHGVVTRQQALADWEREKATPAAATAEGKLPLRFWIMIDNGLMTLDQARAEWAKQQTAGVEFEALS